MVELRGISRLSIIDDVFHGLLLRPAAPATPAPPASAPASTTSKAMPPPPPKPPARTPVQSRPTGKGHKHNPCQERREQAQSVRAKEEARVRMHAQQVHQQELELQAQQCQQSLQGPESLFWRGIWLQGMAQAVAFIFASRIGGRVPVTLAICLLLARLLLAFIYQ